MSWTLFRYVAVTYLRYCAAVFVAVLAIYLVADYVDRAKVYTGPGWVMAALELYANKALVVARQLAPAALLLGAGAAVSALRKTGEITAMRALTAGPTSLYVPVAVCALLSSGALIAFDEWMVTRAGARVDQITLNRFHVWGDWRFYNTPKRWFRTPDWIIHLRGGGGPEVGYDEVSLMRMTQSFHLERRVDAAHMTPAGGTTWRLEGVRERTFDDRGGIAVREHDVLEVDLGVDRHGFAIRQGRPEQMRVPELRQQIVTRDAVGLPSSHYRLALHNRFAYPLAGFPAALLAVGLALRPGRRGNLTASLVEGLAVAVSLWGLMVVGRALVLGERVPPAVAAWLPSIVLVVAAAVLWLRREGRLGWHGS